MSMASRIPFDRSSSTGAGSLGTRKVRNIERLLPLGVGVGQDGRQEPVGTEERLRVAFEFDLAILVQLLPVERDAPIQDGVEPVASGFGKVLFHQVVHLLGAVNLVAVERRPEVVELVGVGLLRQDCGTVVVGERVLDDVGVV